MKWLMSRVAAVKWPNLPMQNFGGNRGSLVDHYYFHIMEDYFDLPSCEDTYYSTVDRECPIGDEPLDTMREIPNLDSPGHTLSSEVVRELSYEMSPLPTGDDMTLQGFNLCPDSPGALELPLYADELPTDTDLSTIFAEQPELVQQEELEPVQGVQSLFAQPAPLPFMLQEQSTFMQPAQSTFIQPAQPTFMQQAQPTQHEQPMFMQTKQPMPTQPAQPTFTQHNVVPSEEELENKKDSIVLDLLYDPSIRPFTDAIITNRAAIVNILNSPKQRTYWGDHYKLLRNLLRAVRRVKGDGNHGPYSTSRIAKVLLNAGILSGCLRPEQALRRLCDRLNRKDDSPN